MPIRIATWNVNSVRQRIDLLLTWLKECQPDIVCLQEIKCVDEAFPRLEIEALGYNVVTTARRRSTVSLCSRSSGSTRPSRGWPATTRTPMLASSKAW